MKKTTVLVLGAGSSKAMGYPIGQELRKLIIEKANTTYIDHICGASSNIDQRDLDKFIEAFRNSQMYSIDAFLARRPEFSHIGRVTISAILLKKENAQPLHSSNDSDNWYKYFFNKVSSHDWNSLNFDNFSVITFNYDRSLEHYLLYAIIHSYGVSAQEAYKKLCTLKIIHVYGSLGLSDPFSPEYHRYGSDPFLQQAVFKAAEMLKVIPEGRNDDETLCEAREILTNANKIAFLGFGFDETNLERLDSKNTCKEFLGNRFRTVVGTCMGLKRAEAEKAIRSTADPHDASRAIGVRFFDSDCITMLRETLILES